MKPNLIIVTMLFILNIVSPGQEFAPIGAEWYYSSSAWGGAPARSEYYHLIVEKDTTINDNEVRKISRMYCRYQGDSVKAEPYYIHQNGDTVFFYDPDVNKFYRLLIFNATQGDTLTFDIPFENSHPEDSTYRVVIDTVITEAYDGTELQKYVLDQIDEFGWLYGFYLEKVGGYEWFLPLGLVTIPEHDGPVRCYHDNEINVNFWGNDCEYRIINDVSDLYGNEFKVYPNPTKGLLHIDSDVKIDKILLHDNTGKIIIETTNTTIDFKDLARGVYYIRICSNNNLFIQKIIYN